MKQILVFVLMTFFVQIPFCQNLSDTVNVEYSKNSPSRFSFGFGVPTTRGVYTFAPNLNDFLKSQRLEPTENFHQSVPFNAIFQVDRIKLEFGLSTSLPQPPTNSETRGQISFGYAVFAERNYFIYFNTGVGYASIERKIDFRNSNQAAVSLASVIQSGVGRSISLQNSGAFLDFSLESLMRPKNPNAIGTGFKIGYHYGLTENLWTASSIRLTDAPSDRMNGFYLQATINIYRDRKSIKRGLFGI